MARRRRNKYRPGPTLRAEEACAHILSGGSIYVHSKFMHNGWVRQWKLQLIDYYCRAGGIRKAINGALEPGQLSLLEKEHGSTRFPIPRRLQAA